MSLKKNLENTIGNSLLTKTIFILEDEIELKNALEIALEQLGAKKIISSTTIKEAKKSFFEETIHLVLIDRQLPDGDGLDFCKFIREKKYSGPILFLTARGQINDKVDGLIAGADDYLPKPFSWDELKARLYSLSRRILSSDTLPELLIETSEALWSMDKKNYKILGHQGWKRLTPLEFKMVAHLIDASGSIVSREELLREVWGFRFLPKTRTVDYFMGRIRKNFEINADEPKHFLTIRGAGYRFIK